MILIADDNEADARLIIEALRENGLHEVVYVAADGQEAMDYLNDQSNTRPRLLVLDLNMPRKTGMQVLREIKADADLCLIPVVVLTTSEEDRDILGSYRLHANSYITKPLEMDRFIEVVAQLHRYWFEVAQLPRDRPPGVAPASV